MNEQDVLAETLAPALGSYYTAGLRSVVAGEIAKKQLEALEAAGYNVILSPQSILEKAYDVAASGIACVCGETITSDMPYVDLTHRVGVLWHGNAEGGGHSSNAGVKP